MITARSSGPPDWARPSLAIWTLVLTFLLGGLGEGILRWQGHVPCVHDGQALWAYWRRRVHGPPGTPLVLLGASRIISGVDGAELSRCLGGRRVVQLAQVASAPYALLADLCRDGQFRGTILLSTAPDILLRGTAWKGAPQSFRPTATEGMARWAAWDEDLSIWIGGHLQERSVLLGRRGPFRRRHAKIEGPFMLDGMRYAFDRSGQRSPSHASPGRADEQAEWLAMTRRRCRHARSLIPLPAQELFDDLIRRRVLPEFARLRERGGRVILLRMPVTGAIEAQDLTQQVRARYWDCLVARSGAPAIHYRDEAALQGFPCLDGSHMAAEGAVPFTRALAGVMMRKGL